MKKTTKYTYNSIDEYHYFKSFEEIKNVLNYFEALYFKDKNFLFFKIKKREKLNAIISLRQSLSRSIFSFVFKNHSSLLNNEINFIANFYSKYFINKYQKRFNLLYYINPINIFYIINKKFKKEKIIEETKHNFYFHPQEFNYYRKYYWLISLIICLDDKSLNEAFLYHFKSHEFFYYYIIFYFERYHRDDYIIKNHYLFDYILLNLEKFDIETFQRHLKHDEYNILIDLIKHAQEKQNLKHNIENF